VTTVKLMTMTRRPSALPAVCAPVSGVPGSLAVSATHGFVGYAAVRDRQGIGTLQIQARWVEVEGRTAFIDGLKVEGTAVPVNKASGDVRGIPPRGRPV
jgi:hypothetical protein